MLFKWLLTWVTGPFSGEKNNASKNNAGTTRFLCQKKSDVSLYITLKNNNSNG